jgi:3-oxoacyl-[acyl-carrier-protein] synthase-1
METKKSIAMSEVFISADSLITPFGLGSQLAFEQIKSGKTAIQKHIQSEFSSNEIYAAIIQEKENWFSVLNLDDTYTRLEKLVILCLTNLIQQNNIQITDKTLIVLSSTKGNISILDNPNLNFPRERAYLTSLTQKIESYYNLKNSIQIVSNACISGSLAIEYARRWMLAGKYENAIVLGADEVSKFIVSGFESFQAVSSEICKPFDANRTGINLGEAIGAVYLSKFPTEDSVKILGGGNYNDANHISGPSRTGEGLFRSIQKAMEDSGVEIDYISAHGTATLYNDEMESIAYQRSGLLDVPTNSLKGYFGHTLGTSGILETIMGIHSLRNNTLIKSYGFDSQGTSEPVNMIRETTSKELKTFLKTAAGFGGSNIATIFKKLA